MFQIIPFHKGVDRSSFDCGSDPLNSYLTKQVNQDIKRNVTRCFVAVPKDHPTIIAGFYTLGAYSIESATLPEIYHRKLPRYPVPCALLGRLAIDITFQGKGLGKALIADACKRLLQASEALAVHALLVDAKDGSATAFYRNFGFISLPARPDKLFLRMNTVSKIVEKPA